MSVDDVCLHIVGILEDRDEDELTETEREILDFCHERLETIGAIVSWYEVRQRAVDPDEYTELEDDD